MKLYLICIANICIYFDERQYYYTIVYFKQNVAVMKKAEFSKQWEMDNYVSCCITMIVKHNCVQMFEVAMMLKEGYCAVQSLDIDRVTVLFNL